MLGDLQGEAYAGDAADLEGLKQILLERFLMGFDDGWICLTHEVVAIDPWHRRYLHRFVRFDRALRVVAITEPFRFADEPIEFAAGLAHDADRDVLIASYGVQDCRAMMAGLDAPAVRRALVALPEARAGRPA